jgi:hypothetical protein
VLITLKNYNIIIFRQKRCKPLLQRPISRCRTTRVFTKFRILKILYISSVFILFRILYEIDKNVVRVSS